MMRFRKESMMPPPIPLTICLLTTFLMLGPVASRAQQQSQSPTGAESTAGSGAAAGRQRDGQLSDDEIGAMAGTIAGDGSGRGNDAFGKKIQEALRREPVASNGVRATHVNVPYGEHPRNVFDIWMVDSERPAPLVVFIHGGGFRRGDKSLLYDSKVLADLLDAGFSVAGINYRFSHQSPEGALGSLKDTARFLQFIRFHARTYRIDKQRIATYGGSAGGAASLWLAFHDDLADPADPDPIARESTRLACAAAMATPSTLDVLKWQDILGISHDQAIATARSFGAKDEAELLSERGKRLRAETDLVELMSADDPPIFVHNNESGEVPRHVGHMAHHPNHARLLKERADALGIEAIVFAPQIGVAHPSGENLIGFFLRHLSSPAAD
jgi:acetyl esterase/lipase